MSYVFMSYTLTWYGAVRLPLGAVGADIVARKGGSVQTVPVQ